MPIQLVSRVGCHLCEEAEQALRAAGVSFQKLDVDADVELSRLYDFRVPVVLVNGRPVAEGRIGEPAVRRLVHL